MKGGTATLIILFLAVARMFARLPVSSGIPEGIANPEHAWLSISDHLDWLERLLESVNEAGSTLNRWMQPFADSVREGGAGAAYCLADPVSSAMAAIDASECPPTFGARPGDVRAVSDSHADEFLSEIPVVAKDSRDVAMVAKDAKQPSDCKALVAKEAKQSRDSAGLVAKDAKAVAGFALTSPGQLSDLPIGFRCSLAFRLPGNQDFNTSADLTLDLSGLPDDSLWRDYAVVMATKLTLNRLSTGGFVRAGKTFGNQMICMLPSNSKLVDRAARIVASVAGVDSAEARIALTRFINATGPASETSVSPVAGAVLLLRRPELSAEQAHQLLCQSGGRLRDIIS